MRLSQLKHRQNLFFFSYILLGLVALIWGSQYLLNKILLTKVPCFTLAFCRIVIGYIFLSVVDFLTRSKNRLSFFSFSRRDKDFFILGFLEATLPFTLILWGQKSAVTSGSTSIIISTIPLWSTFFAAVCPPREKWQMRNLLSVFLGLLGVFILIGPTVGSSEKGGLLLGSVAILLGAICFAFSLVWLRRLTGLGAVYTMKNVLFYASLQMVVFSFLGFFDFSFIREIGFLEGCILLYLGIFCGGVVYLLYFLLIRYEGVQLASMVNYLVPVISLILGNIFLNESIYWYHSIAILFILLSIFLVQTRSVLQKRG